MKDKAIQKVIAAGYKPVLWRTYNDVDYQFIVTKDDCYHLVSYIGEKYPIYRDPFPATRIYKLKFDGKFTDGILSQMKRIYGFKNI